MGEHNGSWSLLGQSPGTVTGDLVLPTKYRAGNGVTLNCEKVVGPFNTDIESSVCGECH
jgi:hypothetical protein